MLADDNCGEERTVSCGTCTDPEVCGADEPNVCGEGECTPTTCGDEGANCGSIGDGCGDLLNCGTCSGYDSCGGGGEPNVCGCTATTCVAEGKDCGAVADGCGDLLDCGTCTDPLVCGAEEPNVCGEGECTPTTCVAEGKNCDEISDNCGDTLDCGTCSGYESCGGGGEDNVCGCTPTTCTAEGKNCDEIPDNCGDFLDCGVCSGYNSCGGGGEDNVCGCTPTTCVAEGKNCNSIANGCGGTLYCGACDSPATCGGGGETNVCGCPPAVAADPSKANNMGVLPLFPGRQVGQSFTVSSAAPLKYIRIEGNYQPAAASGILTVAVFQDTGGFPDAGPLVGSVSMAVGDTNWLPEGTQNVAPHDFDFSDQGINLATGTTYWIVLSFTANYAYVRVYIDDVAPEGEVAPGDYRVMTSSSWSSVNTTHDIEFQVHVCD